MSHYTMIYKNGERMRYFLGLFISYCSLVFYILGAFLIKQLFHSRLLDIMIIANSALRATRAHGIIVKYPLPATVHVSLVLPEHSDTGKR